VFFPGAIAAVNWVTPEGHVIRSLAPVLLESSAVIHSSGLVGLFLGIGAGSPKSATVLRSAVLGLLHLVTHRGKRTDALPGRSLCRNPEPRGCGGTPQAHTEPADGLARLVHEGPGAECRFGEWLDEGRRRSRPTSFPVDDPGLAPLRRAK